MSHLVSTMAAQIKVGTTAWADRILVDSGWYPPDVRSAEAKLRYYASHFPIVENDSTYWAFPDRERVARWAERTPTGFTMNMKAHALLTRHYCSVRGLPRDIRESLPDDIRTKPRVYPRDLGTDIIQQLTARFRAALEPLHLAGRLGVVLFQFPVWFPISAANKRELRRIRDDFQPYRVAIELRNETWMTNDNVYETLDFLGRSDLIYTCVDEPQGFVSSLPPIAAVTSDIAVVRMHGRNATRWERGARAAGGRFEYRYSLAELTEWVPKILGLAERAREVHVLMSNGLLDNAIRNAGELTLLLDLAQRNELHELARYVARRP